MATRHYAIKRPDGSWIMSPPETTKGMAWARAIAEDIPLQLESACGKYDHDPRKAKRRGYRCCEVRGFTEVENEY